MHSQIRNLSALSTSILLHVAVLLVLWLLRFDLLPAIPDVVVETFFNEEQTQERFVKELDEQTEISETQNINAGGVVSTTIGGSGSVQVAQTRIETSQSLQDPDLEINISDVTLPGQESLGDDLGVGEVNGEIGAMVEGYGAALSRLTQELIRLMRERRVIAVWMFATVHAGALANSTIVIAAGIIGGYMALNIGANGAITPYAKFNAKADKWFFKGDAGDV